MNYYAIKAQLTAIELDATRAQLAKVMRQGKPYGRILLQCDSLALELIELDRQARARMEVSNG